jgi:hypothetical protein
LTNAEASITGSLTADLVEAEPDAGLSLRSGASLTATTYDGDMYTAAGTSVNVVTWNLTDNPSDISATASFTSVDAVTSGGEFTIFEGGQVSISRDATAGIVDAGTSLTVGGSARLIDADRALSRLAVISSISSLSGARRSVKLHRGHHWPVQQEAVGEAGDV